jgi:FkbM family methyltransferase
MSQPLIVDLGANIGLSTAYHEWFWPRATNVAVEPAYDNVEMIRLNAPNAIILNAAIASEPCRVEVVNPGDAKWSYRTERTRDGPIKGITVNSILEQYPDHIPFICKIDIEGAEKELFSKNTEWLSRFPVIIIELHDWMRSGSARNFLHASSVEDRDFLFVGENLWCLANN